MMPLIISSVCIAGFMWLSKFTAPISSSKWHDEREREKFMREREKLSRVSASWYMFR